MRAPRPASSGLRRGGTVEHTEEEDQQSDGRKTRTQWVSLEQPYREPPAAGHPRHAVVQVPPPTEGGAVEAVEAHADYVII